MYSVLMFISCLLTINTTLSAISWPDIYADIQKTYPTVQHIPPHTLKAWLIDSPKEHIVLLDVRAKEEYAVSHLPGAILWNSKKTDLSKLLKDRIIITYCSVGYRSSKLAVALKKDGFKHVYQLKGSLFAWANLQYPLVTTTHTVHPYNKKWGTLLNADVKQAKAFQLK